MAPEAYILSAAFEGWTKGENNEQIRQRAAKAYDSYQNCGPKSANNLFATGW
jgi:phage-related baseplate assembly protein